MLILAILVNIIFINVVIANSLHKRSKETENDESDEKYIMGNGEIIIGIESNKPPMTYYDDNGVLTGFDTEFAEAVCYKLGIDIVFREIKWDMKEEELNTKNIDCVWNSLTLTEPRRKIFEFTRVYINNRQAVVIRRSDASKFPDAKSLSNAKMTAGLATTGEEALLGDPYLSQSDYTASTSQNEAVMVLKDGLYDAIVIDYTLAKGFIPDDKSDLMVIDNIRLQEEQYAVGFRHGSDMAKRFNDVFLDMILDGSLTTLSEKYNLYDLYSPLIITDSGYIMGNGKMIIGFQGNVPPMSYYDDDGRLIGFDVEFAKAVCHELGIEAEFKTIFWDNKEIDLKNRNIDCIWNGLTVTEERRSVMKFSHVYMSNTQVIVIRKSDASKFTDLEKISKAKLAAASGSTGEQAIKGDPFLSQAEYVGTSSMEEAIKVLDREDVEAIVLDYTLALGSIYNGFPNLMVIEGINFGEEVYAVGFRVGSDMTVIVNELIKKMINDGTLESLSKKYNLFDLYTTAVKTDGLSDLDYIMSKGAMTIGIENNTPPMTYYDNNGELTGFNIEFAKAVCSKLSIDAIFKDIDWDKKETELNNKNIDCLWNSLTVTQENRDNIELSHPYLINKQVVVIRKSDASKFKDSSSLSGSKMSAGLATIGEELLKNDQYLSKAKYTASNSQNEAIVSLKNGKFDAIVIDYTIAQGSINNGNDDLMIVKGISLQEDQYKVGFRSGSDMSKKVNNLILDMIMDGTLATIAKKYDLVDFFSPLRTTDAGYIIGKGKMIIGVQGNLPSMGYYDKNNQLTGFDIDFAKAVCQQLGIDAEFQIIDWNKKETELKNRNIDCLWNGLKVKDESRENIKFSRVYMSNKQVVVIKKSNASKYTDLKSLSQTKLSAEFLSTGENVIKQDQYLSRADYIALSSQNEAILSLKNEIVDAIVIDYTTAIGSITNGYSDLMVLEEMNNIEEMYAIGFRFDSDMTIMINKLINSMINDGTLESLAIKYNVLELYKLTIKNDGKSDLDYIMSKGEMVIGIVIYGPPVSYYDEYGELTGFDNDFSKAVCSKLGIDAIYKIIDWDKKETELSSKNIDCVWSSLTVIEERKKNFKFSQNYLSNKQVVVIRKDDATIFKDLESLTDATVSAVLATSSEDVIKNNPYLSKAKFIVTPTRTDAPIWLMNKKFDALVTDYTIAKGIVANNSSLRIISGISLQEEHYAVGFRVNSDMTEKVNDMILDMILDDSLSNLAKKYNLYDLFLPVKITDAGYIMGKGKMIVGFDPSLSPMSYYDNKGQVTGFDIEFSKAVTKELGIDVEFKAIDWNLKETELKKRSVDCIWGGLSVTEKHREVIKFSRVYMKNKQVVVIRKSNVLKYNSLETLLEAKLSSKIGTLGEEAILTYLTEAKYKGYSSLEDVFIILQKGDVDAIVTDYTMAKEKINNGGFSDLMIVEKIKLIDDEYAVGFRYGSDMSQKINVIINKMITDGSLNEIAKKYDLMNLYSSEEKTSTVMILVSSMMILYFVFIIII